MQNVIRFIDEYVAKHGITVRELSNRMGVDPSFFSRARKGGGEQVQHKTLVDMQHGFKKPEDQAAFLAAYLKDQLVGPARKRIEVAIKDSSRVKEPEPEYGTSKRQELMQAIEEEAVDDKILEAFIQVTRNLKNGGMRRVILGLADLPND